MNKREEAYIGTTGMMTIVPGTVDYKALANEVHQLCKWLCDELGLNQPASHYEATVERLWEVAHVINPEGKLGLTGMKETLIPGLFLLEHPGVGVEKSGPHSPPAVTDDKMVYRYRIMARRAIKGFLVMQELYQR